MGLALDAFLSRCEREGAEPEVAFLGRHEPVRDLLEMMLEEPSDEEAARRAIRSSGQ